MEGRGIEEMSRDRRIKRAAHERIDESRLELINGGTVVVQKNLGPLALSQFLGNSKEGIVRGLLVENEIYYWDGFYAVHSEVAEALGVPYHVEDRVQITRIEDGPILVDLIEPVQKAPMPMQRLTRSSNIYFYTPDGKWRSGLDMAA